MKISIGLLSVVSAWVGLGCFSLQPAKAASFTLNFEDLPGLNATTLSQSRSITDVNAGSNTIAGVTFENGAFRVVGDQYRVDTNTPGPTFGLPRSGRYFLTNSNRTIAPSTLSNDNRPVGK